MRSTRMSEGRGNQWLVIGVAFVVLVIVVIVAAYFTGVFGLSDGNSRTANPTPAMAPTAVATPAVAMTPDPSAGQPKERMIPAADFGEILSEGWVTMNLPEQETAEAWYSLQVDTETLTNTFFYAMYNADSDIINTVKIENYAKGEIPGTAEISLFYANDTRRVLSFDGTEGTVSVSQTYTQPLGPSIFSPSLRVSMVSFGLELEDDTGTKQALLNLDLSGLSEGETFILKQPAPRVVDNLLGEISELITQIEAKRDGG